MVTEQQGAIEPFAERHFTINELAAKWSLSGEFVRQLVQHEPGVTEWVRQQTGRRGYRVLRIPQSVAERVYRRALSKARGVCRRRRHTATKTADRIQTHRLKLPGLRRLEFSSQDRPL